MALVIQATTISGKIIEGARWEVNNLCAFQKGQKISVELPIKDSNLIGYLSKAPNPECMLDGDKMNFSVVMSCSINEVRHMAHVSNNTVDTLVMVVPTNRVVESVLQYVLTPTRCDPRFVKAVRGTE